ncbi:MAG: hypothetical protein SFX73_19670 [Kofleriaceae bacterium]|nr:hypothetical protein [Kofleriaceae bacterium]
MTNERTPDVHHAELGALRWNESELAYTVHAGIGGTDARIEVIIDPDAWSEPLTETLLLDQAASTLQRIRAQWPVIEAALRSFLVEAYTDEWRGDRPAQPPEELTRHLALEVWSVYHDGASELLFNDQGVDDEGLFHGHYVTVSLDADGTISGVDLAG